MSDHLTREQLKTDEVGEALERGVEYLATNWKRILIGLGLLTVAIVAGAGWMKARTRASEAAWYQVSEAVQELSTAPEAASASLDAVISDGGDAARVASLYRATVPGSDVATLWQQAAGDDVDAVTAVARINELDRLRESQSWDQALALLDGDGAGLPEDLHLYQKALTLSQAGRSDEAAPLVEALVTGYPGSPWIADARKLQATG